jgi:hypothetical protein
MPAGAVCYHVTMVTQPASRWMLLTYRVPREPSVLRVGIWRKLKRLGALLVLDAVWALPATPRCAEQFQWLAAEVHERGGEAMIWRASLASADDDARLVAQFGERVEALYRELLTGLAEPGADFQALSKRFQQARTLDFFDSPLGGQVRQALLDAVEEASS